MPEAHTGILSGSTKESSLEANPVVYLAKEKAGYLSPRGPALIESEFPNGCRLSLAYPEHLRPTYGTHTLGCRLAILHGYALGILHFPFSTTFHTICLHSLPPLLGILVQR